MMLMPKFDYVEHGVLCRRESTQLGKRTSCCGGESSRARTWRSCHIKPDHRSLYVALRCTRTRSKRDQYQQTVRQSFGLTDDSWALVSHQQQPLSTWNCLTFTFIRPPDDSRRLYILLLSHLCFPVFLFYFFTPSMFQLAERPLPTIYHILVDGLSSTNLLKHMTDAPINFTGVKNPRFWRGFRPRSHLCHNQFEL